MPRCSSMVRLSCSASMVEDDVELHQNTDEATIGTAVHEAIASFVNHGVSNIDAVCQRHGVDMEEVRFLVYQAKDVLKQLKFPAARAEVKLAAAVGHKDELTGTMDLLWCTPEECNVLDWKTGRVKSDHRNQMLAYSFMVRANMGMPTNGVITAMVVWIRLGEMDVYEFTNGDLDEFEKKLVEALRHPNHYNPTSGVCGWCPRQMNCAGLKAYQRSTCEALAPLAEDGLMSREAIGSLYRRSKQIERALRRYDELLKDMLKTGPVPTGDGKTLVLEEKEQDVVLASKVIADLTLEEQDVALSASKAGLERVWKNRGLKGAQIKSELTSLEERGAITKKTVTKIKEI